MQRFTLSAIAISTGLFAAAACMDNATTTREVTTTPANRDSVTTKPAGELAGDEAALAMLTALNQGEVDQANAAIPKLAHQEAKYFATMMLRHHSEGITKLSGIAAERHMTMTDNGASRAMKKETADLVGKMSTMTAGPAFDRFYMQAQIDGHTKALEMLDSEIIPKLDDAALKALVHDMRAQVADHLAKAREILPSMPST